MSYYADCQEDNQKNIKKLKIVFLGDKSVGKSSIIRRFISNSFQQMTNTTVGVDFMTKRLRYKNTKYKLELWDTAGQQKYRSLVKGYIKGADVSIFVYDSTKLDSYLTLVQWIRVFQEISSNNAIKLIVSNKSDLLPHKCQQQIKLLTQKKQQLKKKYSQLQNLNQMEISAKTGHNIQELFEQILHQTWVSKTITAIKTLKTLRNIVTEKKINKKNCCQN